MSDKAAAALGPDVAAARVMLERHWRDPAEYDGRWQCARCGRDANGWYWPLCADVDPATGKNYAHDETCAVYFTYDHDGLCAACEEDLADA